MKKILLILTLIFMVATSACAVGGTYTDNGFFYLPDYGAYGTAEWEEYNAYMQIADTQIEVNKDGLALRYLKTEIDTQGKMEAIWGVTLLNDITGEGIGDLSDVNTTGKAEGKILKFDASGNLIVGTDEGGSGATTFTGLTDTPADYTGSANKFVQVNGTPDALVFDTISSDDLSDVNSIAMLDENEDITGAWTLSTGSIGGVNATELAILDGATLTTTELNYVDGVTSAIQTQLDGKLSDITGESIGDLSDVDLTDLADGKILKYNSTTSKFECETESGGGASQLSDLSDVNTSTPTNKYVLVADGVDFESRQLTSDDLSDVDSIAMLDENEEVTGEWTFTDGQTLFERAVDSSAGSPYLYFLRKRDGDPTSNVSDGDYIGDFLFRGYYTTYYSGAEIRSIVDGTPGESDMPGRLEFLTTPDSSDIPSLRLAIDNAGNIKMGDGGWTNYVNINNAGVLTLEGTANIEGVDATEFGYLDGVTSDIQTQLNAKYDEIGDLPTAGVSDGDTTHISTADAIYDFCETTQDYLKTSENSDSDDDVTDDNVESMTTAGGSGTAPVSDGAGNLTMTDVWTEAENTAADYMQDLEDDTTPKFGGNVDGNDKNITRLGSVGFTQELDNGSKTANFSIDFSTDQKQKCTLTENTITLTLDTTNVKVGNYSLKIVNGGLATLTWASETGSVYFPGGTDPSLTSSGTDIVTFYFDGTDWYSVASLDFK